MIYKYIKENILVPRNIEGRKDKLKQDHIKLLSQEVIEGDLSIDKTFDNLPLDLIKVKQINGNVTIDKLGYIPSWLKDVKIYGDFVCSFNNLKTLKNCPLYIDKIFNCTFNDLKTLEYGPKYVGRSYNCSWNKLTSLKGCPESIHVHFNCSNNELIDLKYGPKYVTDDYYCENNKVILERPDGVIIGGKFENIEEEITENLNEKITDQFYHGSTDMNLDGKNGIHIGTKLAATQALQARIGVPAEGEWDGTREYGKTLLAGKKRLQEWDKTKAKGYYVYTGFNCGSDLPDEDYYPTERKERAKYSDGTPIPYDSKPIVFPVSIIGKMTNSQFDPRTDTMANSMMIRNLKKGNAKSGYFYINDGEDPDSISAVVPDKSFLKIDKINENILIPRNIEGRKDKLKQDLIKLLSQEVIEGDLEIDETFEGIPEDLIKVKEIKGNVTLNLFEGYIPSWLKDVKIHGYFDIRYNKLESLENCPQCIGKNFLANRNYLLTMKGGPIYVGGDYFCDNHVITLEHIAKYIGGNLIIYDDIKDTISKDVEIKGSIIL